MMIDAIFLYVGVGALLCALSAVLTWLLMKRVRIIDVPNERSSHAIPTPRSGGIAIVATFFVGLGALVVLRDDVMLGQEYFWAFCASAFIIAALSILDDLKGLSFKSKLVIQLGASALIMSYGIVIRELHIPGLGIVDLGWVGYALTLLWIIGLTNAFNFMDGIDGIAGGTAVVSAGFFALIVFLGGGDVLALVCGVVVWASLGFLIWNWQPAKIFMGDSGSQFLGFVFAVIAVMASVYSPGEISIYVMVMLFFHFIWDTVYTMARRWRAGENITQAHRSHLYQLMNGLGLSHATVTSIYLGIGVLQGIGALEMAKVAPSHQVLMFLPFVVLQTVLTRVVTKRARAASLI